MKNKYMRLKALLLAGTITLTSSTLSGCGSIFDKDDEPIRIEETVNNFNPGEHIISIPITDDIRKGNFQFPYYPGYEPIGISLSAYGKAQNQFGGGAIMYANTDEVECRAYVQDQNGKPLYLDFGTPMYEVQEDLNSNDTSKVFGVGEHIISIPFDDDNRTHNTQYDYYEGYEVVGIAASARGQVSNTFGGGVVLYKNTKPVMCIKGEDGYTTFGVPVELNKSLELK